MVVATFNGQRFIANQLTSILTQSVVPDRVLVVDDDSTDDTVDIVNEVAAGSSVAVEVYTHPNIGLSANLSSGLHRVDTGLVAFADQDDVWAPTKLARLGALLDDGQQPQAVFSDASLIDATGSELPGTLWRRVAVTPAERQRIVTGDCLGVLLRRNVVTGATLACNCALLRLGLPMPSPEVLHDAWFGLLAASSGGLVGIAAPLMSYRVHDANTIGVAKTKGRGSVQTRRAKDPRTVEHLLYAEVIDRLHLHHAASNTVLAELEARDLFNQMRLDAAANPRQKRMGAITTAMVHGDYRRFSRRGLRSAAYDLISASSSLE